MKTRPRANIGIIRISDEAIMNGREFVSEILWLMRFIPTRAECLHHVRAFEYVGYSKIFRELGDCEEIPEYQVYTTIDESGSVESIELMEKER